MLMESGALKRGRPEADALEAGCPAVRRACSDSTCTSEAADVERIHSALPASPGEGDVTGVLELPPGSTNAQSTGASRFGSHSAALSIQRYGSSVPTVTNAGFRNRGLVLLGKANAKERRWLRNTAAMEPLCLQSRGAGLLSTLTTAALQKQLVQLDCDEQDSLEELRTLRRRYDARMAALSLHPIRAHKPSAGTIARLPMDALQQHLQLSDREAQTLLEQLRTLRHDYNARMAALSADPWSAVPPTAATSAPQPLARQQPHLQLRQHQHQDGQAAPEVRQPHRGGPTDRIAMLEDAQACGIAAAAAVAAGQASAAATETAPKSCRTKATDLQPPPLPPQQPLKLGPRQASRDCGVLPGKTCLDGPASIASLPHRLQYKRGSAVAPTAAAAAAASSPRDSGDTHTHGNRQHGDLGIRAAGWGSNPTFEAAAPAPSSSELSNRGLGGRQQQLPQPRQPDGQQQPLAVH